ncbi:hypothetical protein DFR72_117178 [Lentzea flaviverrucosa]|uniref:Uncharacterized protein n=1 Tax=Lentzea flaviverrucosa TaxID=200379 RepID=A0A1H9XS92_9PSEU|nr:hypothetical protein DFR72_117178 [Lentzea flaviverrucosa]SES49011.1 hypothetical protein SAMN05216195_11739 [Lentzea flaviverrucosa]
MTLPLVEIPRFFHSSVCAGSSARQLRATTASTSKSVTPSARTSPMPPAATGTSLDVTTPPALSRRARLSSQGRHGNGIRISSLPRHAPGKPLHRRLQPARGREDQSSWRVAITSRTERSRPQTGVHFRYGVMTVGIDLTPSDARLYKIDRKPELRRRTPPPHPTRCAPSSRSRCRRQLGIRTQRPHSGRSSAPMIPRNEGKTAGSRATAAVKGDPLTVGGSSGCRGLNPARTAPPRDSAGRDGVCSMIVEHTPSSCVVRL